MRIGLALALLLFAVTPAAADAGLWAKLKEGGRVALIRHAEAPGGVGDPSGFRLEDCATQRNLSDKGRAQARALGAAVRDHAVPIGKVLSSQWCRCRQTAELMDIGPIEAAPTFNNAAVLRDQRETLKEGARAVVAAWRGPGTLIVLTHGANILALTGAHPPEGAIVVVEPDPGSAEKFRLLGRIPPGAS
jgi:phosphohistidine phosphatase SixA